MLKTALPLLEGLPPAVLKTLAEAGVAYRFEPGEKICNQGDTLETVCDPPGIYVVCMEVAIQMYVRCRCQVVRLPST